MKSHHHPLALGILVTLFCALHTNPASADDWPQWRGPSRDGVWKETGIVEKFDTDRLPLRWRVPISGGYTGPTVADGRVYVMDRFRQTERVLCFDAMTGRPLWTHAYDCIYNIPSGYETGPRAAVTLDSGRAYALGAMGHFHCLDAADGTVLWSKDLDEEYRIRLPGWGIAAAPLIEGDLVILQIGGEDDACLVAFDKVSGEERWRALPDRASYAAPIMIEQAGRRVLACWTGDRVVGLNPGTGELYWDHPFKPTRPFVLAISTPVVEQHRLFVTAFYDGALMLKLDEKQLAVEQLWRRRGPSEQRTDSLHSIISTPYLEGDYIYGCDSYGELRCLDAKTGDRIWEDLTATPPGRWSNLHFVRNGKNIWMFNDVGELIISRLSPEGFDEISRAKLIDPTPEQIQGKRPGVTWSHPAFANRHVFARSDKELVCASLAAGEDAASGGSR